MMKLQSIGEYNGLHILRISYSFLGNTYRDKSKSNKTIKQLERVKERFL